MWLCGFWSVQKAENTYPKMEYCEVLRPERNKRHAQVFLNSCLLSCSVHFLHLGSLVSSSFNFLERRQVIVITQTLIVVIDAQAQFDHAVDAASKLCGLVKVKARSQEGGIEQKPNQILHSLVRLVCSGLFPELGHDRMLWVHLHSLLGNH